MMGNSNNLSPIVDRETTLKSFLDGFSLNKNEVEQITFIYGNKVRDILYRGEYHDFVKLFFYDLDLGDTKTNIRLASDIYSIFLFQSDILSFEIFGDGEKKTLSKKRLRKDVYDDLLNFFKNKNQITLKFSIDPEFRDLRQEIIKNFSKSNVLEGKNISNVPINFTICLEKENADCFKVIDSIF